MSMYRHNEWSAMGYGNLIFEVRVEGRDNNFITRYAEIPTGGQAWNTFGRDIWLRGIMEREGGAIDSLVLRAYCTRVKFNGTDWVPE